jgi:hypothetical protein
MTTMTTKSGILISKSTGKIANALMEMQWNCSENAMNLLLYILQHSQIFQAVPDNDPTLLHFDRTELKRVANLDKNTGRLMYLMEELRSTVFTYQDEQYNVLCAPVVAAYSYRSDIDCVTVEISRILWPHLSELLTKYTVFDLAVFTFIQGKYCKRFYLDVMRWANKGTLHLSVANMQERYEMRYNWTDIQRRIITPALDQIHKRTNLKVSCIGLQKKGKAVTVATFAIHKPGQELTKPEEDILVNRYGIARGLAGKICRNLSLQTIRDIRAGIDAAGVKKKINNLGAFSSTVFRSYLQ